MVTVIPVPASRPLGSVEFNRSRTEIEGVDS
jgi:hypothetical protein